MSLIMRENVVATHIFQLGFRCEYVTVFPQVESKLERPISYSGKVFPVS